MSEHHTPERKPTEGLAHDHTDGLQPAIQRAPQSARAAYVVPSFRRIEVVRTALNPGQANDGIVGS